MCPVQTLMGQLVERQIKPLNLMEESKVYHALMGSGLNGKGENPTVSLRMVTTYVLPRIIYGLESCILKKSHINARSVYYRKLLHQIQGLHDNTAQEAIFLLIGALPLEAELDIKTLTLFGAMTRLDATTSLHKLMVRELTYLVLECP